ncbi:tetratricopeptide repeat protein [Sphingomonas sp. CJ20]
MALRAYRQGVAVGDYALASRAAAVLVRQGVAPPDVDVLAFAIAVRARDRAGARRAAERLAKGPFAFLAPSLAAWIARDAGGDGLAVLDAQPANPLANRYTQQQRALLLIAARRVPEGMTALAPLLGPGDDARDLRIDAATLLYRIGERDAANQLLDSALIDSRVARGGKRADLAFGASRLFLGLAAELSTEDVEPLSVVLTRAALLMDPGEDRARLYLADALSQADAAATALKVLDDVRRDGGYARSAAAARVAVLQRAGRLPEALALARTQAMRGDATASDAQRWGELLEEVGQLDAAARAYRLALSRTGGAADWRLHYLLGSTLDRAGDWDGARTALRQAVALGAEEPLALETLGTALVAHGEALAEAQELLEHAESIEPDNAGITDALGWTYFTRGDVERALPLLEKAARADPAGVRANEHLGDAYWRLGRRYEARYAWQAAAVAADDVAMPRLAAKIAHGLTPKTD